MKIRNNYVSNSSSSSFIILYKEDNVELTSPSGCKMAISMSQLVNEMEICGGSSSDATAIIARNKKHIIHEIRGSMLDEYAPECIALVRDDGEFTNSVMFDLSYDDEERIMLLIKILVAEGVAKIVYSSEDREKIIFND